MADATGSIPKSQGIASLLAVISLSLWQLRQTWRFILLAGVGMVAAVVLVCAGPLYSQIALNASFRDFLQSDEARSTVLLQGRAAELSPEGISRATQQINTYAANDIGPALAGDPHVFMQTFTLLVAQSEADKTKPRVGEDGLLYTGQSTLLHGYPLDELSSHIKLVEGRTPRTFTSTEAQSYELEIMLTPDMAKALQVQVGDPIFVRFPSYESKQPYWTMRLVGIFTPQSASDPFWQSRILQGEGGRSMFTPEGRLITGFTSTDVIIDAMSQPEVNREPTIYWRYQLDGSQIDANSQLTSVVDGLKTFKADLTHNTDVLGGVQVITPEEQLVTYRDRLALAQLSVGLLLVLIIGMVLLFISLMADLLIEQRMEAIAVFRSRGASRQQVFGVFAAQALGLSLLALIIGPLLALPTTYYLLRYFLPTLDPELLRTITDTPMAAIMRVWPFIVIVVVVIVGAKLFAIFRETRFDVLALRREAARSTRRPFWQRLYLDVLIGALALVGYIYLLYAMDSVPLTQQASAQIFAPLILLASALFLLAAILLFLRFFPYLLRWAQGLASRRGSVSSMLALAQMARSPYRALRTTLLFTLATAFTIFTLIFIATQNQRIVDVASFQVGTDFSALIPETTESLTKVKAQYQKIPGVQSVALGNLSDFDNDEGASITVKTVDLDSYAKTAYWSEQDGNPALRSVISDLRAKGRQFGRAYVIPVYVDTATWEEFHLRPNAIFTLSLYVSNPSYNPTAPPDVQQIRGVPLEMKFVAVGKVQSLPTMRQANQELSTGSDDQRLTSMLADLRTFSDVYRYEVSQPDFQGPLYEFLPKTLPLNHVWLKANQGADLAKMRTELQKRVQPGTVLYDRQGFVETLQHDPLFINLLGVLLIGTVTPLLLALLSSLLTSWLTAYSRLTIFAVLRALGSAPRHLAGMLSWEQGIVYTIMFSLGILAGALLSSMVLPTMVITDVASIGSSVDVISAVSLLRDLPPIRIILPNSLLGVLGLLFGISLFTLVMMIIQISRPSISQTLRLNAD